MTRYPERGYTMNKKIILGLAFLLFLALGGNLLADPYDFGTSNLLYVDSWVHETDSVSFFSGEGLNLAYAGGSDTNAKWEAPGSESGMWTIYDPDDSSDLKYAIFEWNGTGTVDYIAIKAGQLLVLYQLDTSLSPGQSQLIDWEALMARDFPEGSKVQGISHITGYTSTSVPEPATLVLLGLGLVAVPLVRRYTS